MANVIGLEVMAPARVVAGASGMSAVVTGVAVIEMPVEDFVKPGQLVLTTAMGSEGDGAVFRGLMDEIRRAGACGLAVAVGRHLPELPEGAASLAEQHGFPLIELPWELPFASIIQSILEQLLTSELRLLKQSESVRRSLTSVLMRRGHLPEIAVALEAAIGRPVLVMDEGLNVLAWSAPAGASASAGPGAEGVAAGGSDGWLNGQPVRSVLRSTHSGRMVLLTGTATEAASQQLLAVPVVAAGRVLGYVGVLGAEAMGDAEGGETGTASVTPMQQAAIEHAAAVAAIYLLQERALAETEMRLRGDFVWALATGQAGDEARAQATARRLGVDVSGCYRAMVFAVEEPQQPASGSPAGERVPQLIRQAFGRSLSSTRVLMTRELDRDRWVCFVDGAATDGDYCLLAHRVREQLLAAQAAADVSCGISAAHAGLSGFEQSYQQAVQALEFGRAVQARSWIGCYPQLLALRVVHAAARSQHAAELVEKYLGPLAVEGQGNLDGSEAFRTVRVLIDSGWNTSQAARQLRVHRQTVLYRLERIQAAAGWDIAKPDDRFAVELAVRLYLLAGR